MPPPVATSKQARAPSPLLTAPILPTLLRLSLPNMIAMVATALVAMVETALTGWLGTTALAALALVFPMVMLQQMMSAGAMGGGISSAISRALGAGDHQRATSLALHALVIGVTCGGLFTAAFLLLGRQIFSALGGRGEVLELALQYSGWIFAGSIAIWVTNTLASILRGTGNMKLPSMTLLATSLCQIALAAVLGLGLLGFPALGMRGIAAGQTIAFAGAALVLLGYLVGGNQVLRLRWAPELFEGKLFADILKVGAIAVVSPIQSVLTVLVTTKLVATRGVEALAGYGIGARLEFLLVPIVFAIGVASVPMVGTAIGAGQSDRARRVAWTAGFVGAATVGVIGLVVAAFPAVWTRMFSADAAVLQSATTYFAFAGPAYAFYGFGLALYFASQGSGKIIGAVLAQSLRLAVVAGGAWWLADGAAPAWALFALIAAGMVAYGIASGLALRIADWK